MQQPLSLPLLDRVSIASPCEARWEDMIGDDKVRHCAQCNLNVHNLSAMTAAEAELLLSSKGDRRLCGAFFRRADGTVLTSDCPRGLAAVRARLRRTAARIAAAIGLSVLGGLAGSRHALAEGGWLDRFRTGWNKPELAVRNNNEFMLGKVAYRPPFQPPRLRAVQPFSSLCKWLTPAPPVPPVGTLVAGDICITPAPPAPPVGSTP